MVLTKEWRLTENRAGFILHCAEGKAVKSWSRPKPDRETVIREAWRLSGGRLIDADGKGLAPVGRVFLAIGPFGWGRGSTVAEAVRNCKRQVVWMYVRRDVNAVDIKVWDVSTDTTVSGLGGLAYPTAAPPVEVQTVKARRPRG